MSCLWGIGELLDGSSVLGNKYTPTGRDGSAILLAIIAGISAVLWAIFELRNRDADKT